MWQPASLRRTHESWLSFPECQHYMELCSSQNQAVKMLSPESAIAVPLRKSSNAVRAYRAVNSTGQALAPELSWNTLRSNIWRYHIQNDKWHLHPGPDLSLMACDVLPKLFKRKVSLKTKISIYVYILCKIWREDTKSVEEREKQSYFRGALYLSPFPPWRKD